MHVSLLSGPRPCTHRRSSYCIATEGWRACPVRAGTLPPVQKAVLCLLPTLAPADAPALWPDFLGALLGLLRPELLASEGPGPADAGRARGGGGGKAASAGDRCGGWAVCLWGPSARTSAACAAQHCCAHLAFGERAKSAVASARRQYEESKTNNTTSLPVVTAVRAPGTRGPERMSAAAAAT